MTSLAPRRGGQLAEQRGGGRRGGDPLADLEDRMGDLIRGFFADPFAAISPIAAAPVPLWVPPVDIEETDDSYILEMDLPGVKPEDINVELRDNNELRITGQYRQRERAGIMRRQNRRGGQFEYDVILPGDVNAEQIDATLEDGVLLVRLGKAQGGQARRIEVRGGTAGGAAGTGTAAGGTPPAAGTTAEGTTGGVSSADVPPGGTAGGTGATGRGRASK